MTPRREWLKFVSLSVVAAVAVFVAQRVSRAADSQPQQQTTQARPAGDAAIEPGVFARLMYETTELVLRVHLDPPTRQEMLLAAAKAVARTSGQPLPVGTSRRVSGLATKDEIERWLAEVWTAATKAAHRSHDELQAAAIEGLCSQIPGRPTLLSAAERKVSEQISANRYVGIGIQLSMNSEQSRPAILLAFPRGPARRAGAKPGDLVLTVDGKSTENVPLAGVVEMLRGGEGSRVLVTVRQPDSTETRTLDMTRGVIPIETLQGHRRVSEESWDFRVRVDEPIAYLRLTSISASTLHELRQAERTLESQRTRGVIIDLRQHGGGATLQHTMLVADALLDEGSAGRVRDAAGNAKEFPTDADSLFARLPLVVLVDQFTRGHAEFLAAALQDRGRAVVVGRRTAGDAYVRSVVDLPDGLGAVTLASGVFERPGGGTLLRPDRGLGDPESESVHPPRAGSAEAPDEGGVKPDHPISMSNEQIAAWQHWRRQQEQPEPPADSPAPDDPQLDKAIELLRAATQATAG